MKSKVFKIFSIAESYFLSGIWCFVSKLDSENIVSQLLNDTYLISLFGNIRESREIKVKKEIAINLLSDMLMLYIRVRSHSYAKDKIQCHKMDKDSSKSRSLRTEIKKATTALDGGH